MARLIYHETAPGSQLAHLIDAYWSVFVDPDHAGNPCHWVPPDGCYTLSIGITPASYVALRAPSLSPFRAPCIAGQRVVGARFKPGVDPRNAVSFLRIRPGLSMQEVFRRVDAWAARELREPDRRLERMAAFMRLSTGNILVTDTAECCGLGERQLERLALHSMGLTPKNFSRLARLQALVRRLVAEPAEGLASVAARFDFTDQSYMTREFNKLANLTPAAYKRMIADVGFVLDDDPHSR